MFSRIISGCNCLNIPVNILILLNLVDIIKVDYCKQVNENSCGSNIETKDLSTGFFIFWNQTWHLHVEMCFIIAYIFRWSLIINPWWYTCLFPPVFSAENARFLILTILNNSFVNFNSVYKTSAGILWLNVYWILPNSAFLTINGFWDSYIHNTENWIGYINNCSVWALEINGTLFN